MNYNDNELLYLASEKSDEATFILFDKYQPLINRMVNHFIFMHIKKEDAIMTAQRALYQAIKSFNPYNKKSFNGYLQMVIKCRLLDLWRKDKRLSNIISDDNMIENYPDVEENFMDDLLLQENSMDILYYLSNFEKEIYYLYFIEEKEIIDISEMLNKKHSSIVNAIFRIKNKCKTIKR